MRYEWLRLNPDLAEGRAVYGCYAHGTACLELQDGTVRVVGHMTCGSRNGRACAEKELESIAKCLPGMVGADRRISRKVFESWLA